MKRIIIIVLIVLLVALICFVYIGNSHLKRPYVKEDFVKHIKMGMTWESVCEIFGEPDFYLGSGAFIAGYELQDGTVMGINFGEDGVQIMYLLKNQEGNREVLEYLLGEEFLTTPLPN